jgi:hypothetical protein
MNNLELDLAEILLLSLPEILDALEELPDNWLEQIQSMCEYILDERGYDGEEEDEA